MEMEMDGIGGEQTPEMIKIILCGLHMAMGRL